MSQTRRHFTAQQKAEIVRRHVAGKEPIEIYPNFMDGV